MPDHGRTGSTHWVIGLAAMLRHCGDGAEAGTDLSFAAPPPEACSMKVRQLNHVALHVVDVEASVAFYRDTLKLPQMDRPAFDFPGAWFRLGEDQELHLIGDRGQPVHSHHRGTHTAFIVDNLDEWESHLDAMQATRLPRKLRPDGAYQTFVQDPDGHWIELCVPPAKSA